MTSFSNWYTLFSKTTGRWSDGLFVPPPLWSWEMVPFISSHCRLVSSVKISFTHIFTIWNSSSVIVFVSSLGHLSGPVLLPGFKHIATYFLKDLTCKRGSVGQSEGLSIPRSSVRFRLKPDTSNSHEFELHRPSNKGTKLLLKVIKAIIIINLLAGEFSSQTAWLMLCCPISVNQ